MEMNIYQKMSAITAELSAVAKNLDVGVGKSSYKAVGEADVLAAVKPLETKYGIYSFPSASKMIDSQIITRNTTDYNGNAKEVSNFFMRIERTYRFVNADNPSEFIEVTSYGDGVDSCDKAPGKAMTYADKYALLKAYKIITGDDPDQAKSEESTIKADVLRCADCGAEIVPIKNGAEIITPVMIEGRTKAKYGRCLCTKCAKAANERTTNESTN